MKDYIKISFVSADIKHGHISQYPFNPGPQESLGFLPGIRPVTVPSPPLSRHLLLVIKVRRSRKCLTVDCPVDIGIGHQNNLHKHLAFHFI